MKLTSRSEYALLAMIHLTRYDGEGYLSAEQIAKEQEIPLRFLEQILLALKRAQYLMSSKGQHGGFRLAKDAHEISVAEIIRFFDGALAPTESVSEYFYESTPIEKEAKLTEVFKDIRDYTARRLEETSLADIA